MTSTSAVYAVNRYSWALLNRNLNWQKVNGLVPIIPANQEPEFTQYNAPFMVYGTASEWAGPMWWLQQEQCAYTVYSTSVGEINSAVRVLNETFMRMDEAATDINQFVGKVNTGQYDDLHFKTFEVVTAQSAQAAEEEGGRQNGLIVIRYKYTTEPNINFDPEPVA
jgi:hypothetical protein